MRGGGISAGSAFSRSGRAGALAGGSLARIGAGRHHCGAGGSWEDFGPILAFFKCQNGPKRGGVRSQLGAQDNSNRISNKFAANVEVEVSFEHKGQVIQEVNILTN